MLRHVSLSLGIAACLAASSVSAQPAPQRLDAPAGDAAATPPAQEPASAQPPRNEGTPSGAELAAVIGADPGPPRFGRAREHSLGLRVWLWNTPAWMVGVFSHVQGEWSGPLTVSPALEYVFRNGLLDIVVGIQYLDLGTSPGLIRGKSESDVALERVESQLWTLGVNALFLYTSRINDWFEIQYGGGVGVSYVGGDLYRNQVEPNGTGGYVDCRVRPPPGGTPTTVSGGGYCDQSNNHYVYSDGTRYSEPRSTSGGSLPPVVPFVSLPHVALHFRPHRNVDIRVDGGFGIIGFYGGLASHFVF